MEVEIRLALIAVYKNRFSCFWIASLGKFIQSELKKLFPGNFCRKSLNIEVFSQILLEKLKK